MSFVDKIKGWGQRGSAEHDALEHDAAFADAYAQAGAGVAALSPSDLPLADVEAAATFETPAPPAVEPLAPSGSIISEAMPSEISRIHRDAGPGIRHRRGPARSRTASHRQAPPVAQQQRILIGMLAARACSGWSFLTRFVAPSLSASRGSSQVAAQRPGPDAVATAGQVGVAGPGGQRAGVRRTEETASGPRQQRAQPEDRRGDVPAAPAASRACSTRCCRWSTGPRRAPVSSWRRKRC